MGYAHEYAAAIMRRGRVPMEPVDFVPDWADGPRKTKFYPGTERLPLPDAGPWPTSATTGRGLGGDSPEPVLSEGEFGLPELAGLLGDSYGLTGRRLGVQANTDLDALPSYPLANWSRGTASGGGLYPVAVYWVSGAGGPVPPGVHHYSPRHHALRRLLTGDVTGEVRAALGEGAPGPVGGTDQYLVLGVKYWQNAFKYNSFSFHAVSMDVGALLGSWRTWARARGLSLEPALWFDEARLARLLGVRGAEEGIFAVVPLPWAGGRAATAAPVAAGVARRDVERSRRVVEFDALRAMQEATSADAARRPPPGALAPAAVRPRSGGAEPLPAPVPLETGLRTALRARRSSFGRFAAGRPLEGGELAALLAAAHGAARLGGDAEAAGAADLTRLYVFVNHVAGIAPGAYAYDPAGGGLLAVKAGPPGPFLQKNYFLANYNLEEAAAVLVPAIRTHAVLDAVGGRGYRLVNAVVGAVAQATYTASAALGVGCGVALGFDNIAYREELGMPDDDGGGDGDGDGEQPLLIMMVGHERPAPADFRYRIA
ncbi:nitroreductase family protein [Streptomyces avicenniae]|uniref:nitroreductase family protein n=1 Tax=Streptomyces avicenniae TaxID=500153 RepID=UPI000699F68B|nr:nitroreductase family protein [Streptomyces avicenniae]